VDSSPKPSEPTSTAEEEVEETTRGLRDEVVVDEEIEACDVW